MSGIARSEIKRALDGRARPSGADHYKSKPVTIRGVEYPSHAAAARELRVSVATIQKHRAEGRLDEVGLGPQWHTGASHHNAVEITIRGKTYPTIADAAADLGVTEGAIRVAKRKGTLDGVGLQKARRRRSAPVTIRGVEHPSPAAAAKALGVDVNEIYRLEKTGRLDEIGPPEDPEDAIVPFDPAASPDHDADGNLTPEAIKRRAADFMRRRAGRRV